MDPHTEQISPRNRHPILQKSGLILKKLFAPFRRVWRWFAHQPRGLQFGVLLVLIAALVVSGYFGRSYLQKRGTARELAAAWGDYAYGVTATT